MSTEHLTSRLVSQMDGLEWVMSTAPTQGLRRRPQPDRWSAHEHLSHLACYQQRFCKRLEAILTEEQPMFRRYRAEEDEEWPRWQTVSTEHALESLKSARRELLALVESLSDAQLERTGVHSAFGALAVPRWIEFFLLHEAHHAYMVMTLAHQR